MEFYFNEYDSTKKNESNTSLPFESDESEFDEFEHHLNQYENKDDEEFSIMENDVESYDDSHQISLATSFCRNKQEQNDDFLDDKFNGDILLDNFGEDKSINCKYSEDFFMEQQCVQDKQQLSDTEFDHQSESDRHVEERSSEDERVIENRRQHFLNFLSTIPKVCTPSICGTISKKLSRELIEGDRFDKLDRLNETNEEILLEDEDKFSGHDETESDRKFDWSIDQLATLKPVDISFDERRFLRFKDFENDQLTQEKLIKENEMFFSQETIVPSPKKCDFIKNIEKESPTNACNNRTIIAEKIANELEGKDSGNYSNEGINLQKLSNNIKSCDKDFDQFEFSFNQQSDQRISKIEFDFEYAHHHTPSSKSFVACNSANKLDFKPNSLLQTSTPCTSFLGLNQIKSQLKKEINQDNFEKKFDDQNFIHRINEERNVPLQEKNIIKQKRRLFHNFSISNEFTPSGLLSFCPIVNENNSKTNNSEKIYDESEEQKIKSSLSMMSVCNNNSLTPKPKKTRANVVKSFAKRLDEIEFFGNEENSKPISSDSSDNASNDYSNNKCQNSYHNMTDSNCLVICKNFNNLLNNSDSGCYMSLNGSSSNSAFDAKTRVLFN